MPYSILAFGLFIGKGGVGLTGTQQILLPYKITLLSNGTGCFAKCFFVLLPYKITLLSNGGRFRAVFEEFCYPIKLHYSQTNRQRCDIL